MVYEPLNPFRVHFVLKEWLLSPRSKEGAWDWASTAWWKKDAPWGELLGPRGSIYTTIMELGPQNHSGDGLLGPNSIIVVYVDPLGASVLDGNRAPQHVR